MTDTRSNEATGHEKRGVIHPEITPPSDTPPGEKQATDPLSDHLLTRAADAAADFVNDNEKGSSRA